MESTSATSGIRPARPDTLLRSRERSYFNSWQKYAKGSDTDSERSMKLPTPNKHPIPLTPGIGGNLEASKEKDDVFSVTVGGVEQHRLKHVVIFLSLASANLFMAFDESIIATAIPKITEQFGVVQDVGWYGTAYLATSCAFRPLFGKFFTLLTPKWIFLGAIVMFEIGSLLSGLAPSAAALIVGRAVAGIGGAGIATGPGIILAQSLPKHKLPIYQSMFSAIYAIASVTAPLLGGALTTEVSWRWCFLINVPIGALSVLSACLYLPRRTPTTTKIAKAASFRRFDALGAFCIVGGVMLLTVALQFGGSPHFPWHSAAIICFFVLCVIFTLLFIIVQYWLGDCATFPPRIVLQRTVITATVYSFCNAASSTVIEFYWPLWFQLVKRVTPFMSGVMTLPLVVGASGITIIVGLSVSRLGYFKPFMVAGSLFTTVTSGLTRLLRPTTTTVFWALLECAMIMGFGLGVEQPYIAVFATLSADDVASGVAMVSFGEGLGKTIALSIAKLIFAASLFKNNAEVLKASAAGAALEPPSLIPASALEAYNTAITLPFCIGVAMGVISLCAALIMPWISVLATEKTSD